MYGYKFDKSFNVIWLYVYNITLQINNKGFNVSCVIDYNLSCVKATNGMINWFFNN